MQKDKVAYLFYRYLDPAATQEEKAEFLGLLRRAEHDDDIRQLLDEVIEESDADQSMDTETARSVLQAILHQGKEQTAKQRPVIRMKYWVAAAAVVLLALTTVAYLYFNNSNTTTASNPSIVQNEIAPGKDNAILTLADGSQIVLEQASNGDLAQQGNVKVIKLDGLLRYDDNASAEQSKIPTYNTVATPRGGQYQLVLADGTKVWLNAASSLQFPTSFAGDERVVQLTGEAYFEVAKNPAKKFRVLFNSPSTGSRREVEVLGTHFNINSYDDETVNKITLLEGSVKVKSEVGTQKPEEVIIKPGEQAVVQRSALSIERSADLEQVMAWKNGLFQLNSEEIPYVMKRIARWYDVEVKYEGGVPAGHISGKMSRNLNLSQVLKVLEYSGLKCTVEGRTIIVHS